MTMKRIIMVWVMGATVSATALAQSEKPQPYFTPEEMPNMLNTPLAPPDSLSAAFQYDMARYLWGKSVRETPRGELAKRDAEYGMSWLCKEFSEPFGLEISPKHTPEIYRLLNDALFTCDELCWTPKSTFMRRRPFMVFHEPSGMPKDDAALSKNGSFPSGHTLFGWSAALLLTEINPYRADTLIARGYMYGESRVIVGAHWQSDVNAGYLYASVAVAKLHTSPAFMKQLEKAKKEFARLKKK
jgi:acid phosphatase (class A)